MKVFLGIRKFFEWLGRKTFEVSRTRLGITVAILHISLFLIGIAMMAPPSRELAIELDQLAAQGWWTDQSIFAGRPFHLTYENLLLKAVVYSDMPIVFLLAFLGLLSLPLDWIGILPRIGTYEGSYVAAALYIVLGSIQWMCFWNVIEKSLRGKPRTEAVIRFLHRHQAAIILIIITASLILIPFLNEYCEIQNSGIRFRF